MGYNSFSRSISKSHIFTYCQRKYYFSYYTNGLKSTSEILWLQALLLKNLKGLKMFIGSMIHELIASYLHSVTGHKNYTAEQLLDQYLLKIDQIYLQSKNKNYSCYDPKQKFGLSEHFYHEDIRDDFVQAKENFKMFFQNFLSSNLHTEIIYSISKNDHSGDTSYKIFIESVHPDFASMEFFSPNPSLTGIRILAQPDFGIIKNSYSYVLYDWKSGRKPNEQKVSDQLKLYSYKILSKLHNPDIEKLNFDAFEVYLSDMTLNGGSLTVGEIMEIEDKIVDSVFQMKEKIVDGDFSKNIPLEMSQFPKTLDKEKCKRCRFRFVCNQTE